MTRSLCWDDPDDIIRGELEPGETLLWAGRPRQGLELRLADGPRFLVLALVLGTILIPILQGAGNGNGPPLMFLLFCAPHLLFALAFLVGRPLYDIRLRSRLAYGITSQRALFVAGAFGHSIRSLEFDALMDAQLIRRSKAGGGVIRFGCDASANEPDIGASELVHDAGLDGIQPGPRRRRGLPPCRTGAATAAPAAIGIGPKHRHRRRSAVVVGISQCRRRTRIAVGRDPALGRPAAAGLRSELAVHSDYHARVRLDANLLHGG